MLTRCNKMHHLLRGHIDNLRLRDLYDMVVLSAIPIYVG